jgi:hypothetical protein
MDEKSLRPRRPLLYVITMGTRPMRDLQATRHCSSPHTILFALPSHNSHNSDNLLYLLHNVEIVSHNKQNVRRRQDRRMGGWREATIELEKNGESKAMAMDVKQLPNNIHETESKIWLHENGRDRPLHDLH